jgi:hypothetical protein
MGGDLEGEFTGAVDRGILAGTDPRVESDGRRTLSDAASRPGRFARDSVPAGR